MCSRVHLHGAPVIGGRSSRLDKFSDGVMALCVAPSSELVISDLESTGGVLLVDPWIPANKYPRGAPGFTRSQRCSFPLTVRDIAVLPAQTLAFGAR